MPYYPQRSAATVEGPRFECRLTNPGDANLKLSRCDGMKLHINGVNETIPAAGVTLAPTGLAASVIYWIYAFMSAGVMTLEASTTTPLLHSNGINIKNGDVTRTLVGKAWLNGGPTWLEPASMISVISYYNRRRKVAQALQTASYSTSSGAPVMLSTDLRAYFMAWGDDVVHATFNGRQYNSVVANMVFTQLMRLAQIGGGGTQFESHQGMHGSGNGLAHFHSMAAQLKSSLLSGTEFYYAAPYGWVSGNTGTWALSITGAPQGGRSCMGVTVMG